MADARSSSHASQINLAMVVILAASLSLIVILVFFVLMPAVENVLYNKQVVYSTFLDVPVQVVRSLRDITNKKIEAERRAAEDDNSGDADALAVDMFAAAFSNNIKTLDEDAGANVATLNNEVEEAQQALERTLTALKEGNRKSIANRFGGGDELDEEEEDTEGCADIARLWLKKKVRAWARSRRVRAGAAVEDNASSGSSSKKKKGHTRHYRRTKSSRLTLFLQLLWPLMMFAGGCFTCVKLARTCVSVRIYVFSARCIYFGGAAAPYCGCSCMHWYINPV